MSGATAAGPPRPLRRFVVFTFDSAHDSIAAERLIADAGLSVRAIPKPRSLGGGCGIALRVDPAGAAGAEDALSRGGVALSSRGEIQDY
jgi:hypothetical protein